MVKWEWLASMDSADQRSFVEILTEFILFYLITWLNSLVSASNSYRNSVVSTHSPIKELLH